MPEFLYAECANLTCTSGYTDLTDFSVESIRLLPSEIWAVGEEMNGWGDYPASYSYRVLRAILMWDASSLLCLSKWVIMNSPKYGVIIDSAMRDHIVLLFKLCFKAVIREATKFSSSLFTGEGKEELDADKSKFDCPVLNGVSRWLGFQLSVLYGEQNGKFFSINMLKQCVLDSALKSSVFPVVEKTMESPELKGVDGKLEGAIEKTEGDEPKIRENGKDVRNSTISVSQVVAAVATLYERSWLERKIKALRDWPPLTSYQRIVEHEHISRRANDERKERSDYRPVIEHDGLLFQQTQNQDSNRIKTREELLAEERDYKRRRMSYRGKKMKRSTTQVMRDIINEYMEDIKQARNVADGTKEVILRASVHDSSLNVAESEKNQSTFGGSREDSHGYRDQTHFHDRRSMDFVEKYRGDDKQYRYDSQQHHGLPENHRNIKRSRKERRDYSRSPGQPHSSSGRSIKRGRPHRKDYSTSPDKQRRDSHAEGHRTRRGNKDDPEITEENFPRSSDRSCSMSYRQNSHRREENEHNSEHRYRNTRHRGSISATSHREFEDRYTPSESRDTFEDA